VRGRWWLSSVRKFPKHFEKPCAILKKSVKFQIPKFRRKKRDLRTFCFSPQLCEPGILLFTSVLLVLANSHCLSCGNNLENFCSRYRKVKKKNVWIWKRIIFHGRHQRNYILVLCELFSELIFREILKVG
jgi:hypothetical protein